MTSELPPSKDLSSRLREHASHHDDLRAYSKEQAQWGDDLRLAADLLDAQSSHEPESARTPLSVSPSDIDQLASYYEHGADVDKELAGELAQRDAHLIGEALRALQRERTDQPPGVLQQLIDKGWVLTVSRRDGALAMGPYIADIATDPVINQTTGHCHSGRTVAEAMSALETYVAAQTKFASPE